MHDVGALERQRAGGGRGLRVVVGQQALGHRHRHVGHAGGLDELADLLVGLRVGGALAEHDQRALGAGQQLDGRVDRLDLGQLLGCRVDHAPQRLRRLLGVEHLAEDGGRDVEVDAAGTAGRRGADRPGDTAADVLGARYSVGRLGEEPGGGQLVHLLVVAPLQVDEVALAGAGDLHHREAVGGGVGECDESVEEAWCGHGQADAGLLGEEPRRGGGVACVALVPEADVAQARGLGQPGEIGDRDADDAVDGSLRR